MNNNAIVDQAVRQALHGAPQAVPQQQVQQGVPANMVVAMTQVGILTPKQAWHWIFKGIEPTEFYEKTEGETK